MPIVPTWCVRAFQESVFHILDWREAFRGDLDRPGAPGLGEMRGFHVVFRLRVEHSGTFVVMSTGGSVVKRNGEVVYQRLEANGTQEHSLRLAVGDHLDVAQWQYRGEWFWGVRTAKVDRADSAVDLFAPYTQAVQKALLKPNGPPLKVYTHASQPVRSILSVYSLVLNGYRPSSIHVFGDYQWTKRAHYLMTKLLPFADIVSIARVDRALDAVDARLKPLAHSVWSAMKICVSLFLPPYDYCFIDDDVFVLDSLSDALALREDYDLVYAPDVNYESLYRAIWHPSQRTALRTGNINLGLYFLRSGDELSHVERLLGTAPGGHEPWIWEQGFMACEFAETPSASLPSQRYFYPVLDGLPGGLLGYAWGENPCGFASVHFGGPTIKPDDRVSCALIHEILGRGVRGQSLRLADAVDDSSVSEWGSSTKESASREECEGIGTRSQQRKSPVCAPLSGQSSAVV